ncbi:MAG: NAD(P)/FAD-dependent oxidoreductase [Lachnospiraceae bacterium]|nr:NAD(P)/FAD-dependent oxidoreductase [Lachnospiraceae bacterium]
MKKVVIIGAGPAGITAAYELLREPNQFEVVILEASDKVGGISRTVRHGQNRIDIGGHRFFSKDDRVMEWWQEILKYQGAPSKDDKLLGRESRLIEGGPDPEKTDDVFLIRHRVSRIYYNGKFFDYPISMKPQTFMNMGFLTSMKAGFSYLGSCIHKLPETSLENFYINRFGKKLYSMFFEGYTEKLWGRHPRDISADWGAQRVKGLSIWALVKNVFGKLIPKKNREVETSLIEEFYYPKHGPGQLWEKALGMALEKGAKVVFNARVNEFSFSDDGRINGVKCEDGSIYEADEVISSMPIKDLVKAMGVQRDIPENVNRIAEGLPYRDFVTVGLLVDRLALKNSTKIKTLGNIVPDCWIYVQDTGVRLGRIQIFNNWSPYMLADPEHSVWIGLEYFCDEGDDFWSMSEEACIQMATEELRKIGVIDQNVKIMETCREKVQKAYPAYFDTYSEIDKEIKWLNEIPNLCCVGRNGQHRYNNMDHSMVTAFVAADIIRGKGKKEELWAVNTEKSYHEEKK